MNKTLENVIDVKTLNLHYGKKQALKNININFKKNTINALIGPSGCGKSTFLRCLNKMNDSIKDVLIEGSIVLDNEEVLDLKVDLVDLRKKVGMIFQQANPFPFSIYDNLVYGPKIHGIHDKKELDKIVEKTLKQVYLWDEVKDRLNKPARGISGGQQQRLCIARALSVNPEIILMDEPTSALDPIATEKIEQLIKNLKEKYTVIIVTHNMNQAKRISDNTAFFYEGELIEYAKTNELFKNPKCKKTKDYIFGVFG